MQGEAEQWRDIPGYPGYQASSLGRVRSLDRICITSRGHSRALKGKVLKDARHSGGYRSVLLGVGNSRTVHALVAAAFIGPCPAGHEIDHGDGVKTNNRPGNLEYVTSAENKRRARALGLYDDYGEKNFAAKYTEATIRAAYAEVAAGSAILRAAKKFGMAYLSLHDVVSGKGWKHLGLAPINFQERRTRRETCHQSK